MRRARITYPGAFHHASYHESRPWRYRHFLWK